MHFSAQNHPCKTFPDNQDAFHRSKIIPAKHFLPIRMHSAAQNHPCQTFSANQDAFSHPKSSLQNISCQSGCIPPMKSIWLTYSANPSSRILSHRDITMVQKIHTSTFYLKNAGAWIFCCFNQLRCQPASQTIVMESGQQRRLLRHEASASCFLQCIAKDTRRFPAELLELQVEPASDFICGNRVGIREYRMLPRSC